MEKIDGYNLALKVLKHPQGGVEALLRLSGNDESSWLEMKAGMRLLDEDRAKGETEKDLYWNIARAAIEIMNTSGGILLIGIQDKTHDVVPLSDNDLCKTHKKGTAKQKMADGGSIIGTRFFFFTASCIFRENLFLECQIWYCSGSR